MPEILVVHQLAACRVHARHRSGYLVPSLCDRVDRDGFTPASQRPPSEALFRCAHFAQLIACCYFSLSLTRAARLIALLESLEARTCISLQVAQLAALLLLRLLLLDSKRATPASASGHPSNLACREPLFSLLLDTVSDKTEGDGSREAIEGS